MTAVPFDTQSISYFEDRADGGFAWFVKYDLSFLDGVVTTVIRIRLTGVDVSADEQAAWEKGIESVWNRKVFFDDGKFLYPVRLDLSFVDSGEHQTVTFHSGSGRGDMVNWYASFFDVTRAHEVGHMFGNFDEYAGGATFGGFVTTNTLMSDLTIAGFEDYFFSVEFYTEWFGAGGANVLSTVLAILGGDGADDLVGTGGRDGFYGLGGRDSISGRGGNDYVEGGSGKDALFGGGGRDLLLGGKNNDSLTGGGGKDMFMFDAPPGSSNLDHITDFRHNRDKFFFDARVFVALEVGMLADDAFFHGRRANTEAQLVGYDKTSGIVRYDRDGVGGHHAVKIGILDKSPNNIDSRDFVIG